MAALTAFWICAKCGFRNHPVLLRAADNTVSSKPVNRCEQCGNDGTKDASVDIAAS